MINRNRLAESFMQACHPQRRYLLVHACQLDARHSVRQDRRKPAMWTSDAMITARRDMTRQNRSHLVTYPCMRLVLRDHC